MGRRELLRRARETTEVAMFAAKKLDVFYSTKNLASGHETLFVRVHKGATKTRQQAKPRKANA